MQRRRIKTLRTREGGMFSDNDGGGQPRGAVCAGSDPEPFIFGWGKDAPDLHLPDGIGFRVGAEGGGFESLVLEVHYLEAQARSTALVPVRPRRVVNADP